MQQTERYKLNLIESSDPFLPDALNANTQRIEDVLIDKMEGTLNAFDSRVAALEAHKFYVGTYTGDGARPQVIDLGHTPVAVCMTNIDSNGYTALWTFTGGACSFLSIVEGGFQVSSGYMFDLNVANRTYYFFAFV